MAQREEQSACAWQHRKRAISHGARHAKLPTTCIQSPVPAVDAEGNVSCTFSGQRGQKVPVSLYKVTSSNIVKPFITEMMNPTGLAIR